MAYDNSISRETSGTDPLVPEPMVAEVIQEATKASAVLSLPTRKITMSAKTQRQPVLSLLPQAYWVSGDTGLKQTSKADWENVELVAEEAAVIIPVPEAYIADSGVPIWDEVRPLLGQAIGTLVDQACIFGTNAPASFGDSIFEVADGAGNVVTIGTGDDIAVDVAGLGQTLAEQGYALNGFMSKPGFQWQLVGQRTTDGHPIYTDSSGLYGMPLNEVSNGAWDSTEAVLLGGDFSKAVVGIRQDITVKVFDQGVISDDSGNVVLNLMQQDSVALRVVARFGFATANPVTTLEATGANRAPFAALVPASA